MMWGVAAIGFFSGIISGMGIGGGTILIPALLFLTEVNQRQLWRSLRTIKTER